MKNAISMLQAQSHQLRLELQALPSTQLQERADLIGLINELDLACQRLELCEKWRIYPHSIIKTLPIERANSEYRIMDDCESEDRKWWVEADFDGHHYRLNEGDLIIKP